MGKRGIIFLILIFASFVLYAQKTEWRGQNGTGIYNDTLLQKEWPESGPELIFTLNEIGNGWGSAVFDGTAYFVAGKKDTLDFLTKVDQQGNIVWQKPFGPSWGNSFPDARTTPVVDNERLYAISGSGTLVCLNKNSGDDIWKVDVDKKFNAIWHNWGVAETPLVFKNMVISVPGGDNTTMVAFDKLTGETLWETESLGNKRSYVSPVVYHFNNKDYLLGMTSHHLFAVDPENGDVKWKYAFAERIAQLQNKKNSGFINANSPLSKGNRILVSQGYDSGSVMLEVSDDMTNIKEVWVERTLDNHHHGLVLHEGAVYASNWHNNKQGEWVCMDWETSEILWLEDHNTKGVTVFADDMLYLYDERGNVSLVKPDKDEMQVVSTFRIKHGNGQHWAHPFIADGKLIIRHGDAFAVYNIRQQN
ncbi:MAG: PQQ-like beta-propeller repeat protein [Prolixibacteraceae bacterium]|nr:PQQ-like beta-propeller repeat protein [Prolixibacteraceae bacterium]